MGKLLIFSAPSGSGKTTIVKEALKQIPNLEFSISACSRLPRGNEINGKDYYFITDEEFKKKIELQEFIEWEEVYANQYYGTLKSEISRIWSNGNSVVFDVDVVGGLDIKKLYPDDSLSIFIKAPSIEILKDRLQKRGTETEAQIQKRINKAEHEMGFAKEFDLIITNDLLEKAINQTIEAIKEFIKK